MIQCRTIWGMQILSKTKSIQVQVLRDFLRSTKNANLKCYQIHTGSNATRVLRDFSRSMENPKHYQTQIGPNVTRVLRDFWRSSKPPLVHTLSFHYSSFSHEIKWISAGCGSPTNLVVDSVKNNLVIHLCTIADDTKSIYSG